MTIVESIKCVLQQNNDGLTSKQIYDEIIRQGLYSFGAENPVGVVNAQLRRRCIGLDFPTAYPIKFFEIAGYEGKKIKFRLISTENTATIITAPRCFYYNIVFYEICNTIHREATAKKYQINRWQFTCRSSC